MLEVENSDEWFCSNNIEPLCFNFQTSNGELLIIDNYLVVHVLRRYYTNKKSKIKLNQAITIIAKERGNCSGSVWKY